MIFLGVCSLAQHGSQADLLLKQAINYLIRNIFKNNVSISLPCSSCRCCCVCACGCCSGIGRASTSVPLAIFLGCVTTPVYGEISEIGVCMFINPRQANAIMLQLCWSEELDQRELSKRRYSQKAVLQQLLRAESCGRFKGEGTQLSANYCKSFRLQKYSY